jgi:predicted nuclease of restriction endonuclease-like (RecB) superfamily
MQGFSKTNLKYMRMFAIAYTKVQIGQHGVDQMPWGHNISLLTKLKDPSEREWYANTWVKTVGLTQNSRRK